MYFTSSQVNIVVRVETRETRETSETREGSWYILVGSRESAHGTYGAAVASTVHAVQ